MTSPRAGWEHFEHGADIGVRGFGRSRDEAFEQAALALANAVSDAGAVRPQERVAIAIEAPDDELLLIDWLNALVFEMATRGVLFARFEVAIAGTRLDGAAWGEPFDPARHDIAVEIKGATHTALAVGRDDDGVWYAQCVVDV